MGAARKIQRKNPTINRAKPIKQPHTRRMGAARKIQRKNPTANRAKPIKQRPTLNRISHAR
jgi:hypothetical protein